MLLLFLGVAFACLVGLTYVYEDEIIANIKQAINDKVDTQVHVRDISFSLVDQFPDASIRIENPWIEDKLRPGDTLLIAEELYLQFDIVQVLSEQYKIQKASIENGKVNLLRNQEGEVNYIFWKEAEKTDSEIIEFEVNDLSLTNVDLKYVDEASGLLLDDKIHAMSLMINKGKEATEIDMNADQLLGQLATDERVVFNQVPLHLEGVITISNAGDEVLFQEVHLLTEANDIPLNGKLTQSTEGWDIDLTAKGNTNAHAVMELLPPNKRASLAEYRAKGGLDYDITVKGNSASVPEVIIQLQTTNARVKDERSGLALHDIDTKLSYLSNSKVSGRLTIDRFNAQLEKSVVKISGAVENFSSPWVNGNVDYKGDVGQVLEFLRLDSLAKGSGQVEFATKMKGPMPLNSKELSKLERLNLKGTCRFENLYLSTSDGAHDLKDVRGSIDLQDEDLVTDGLMGLLNDSEFRLDGKVMNFIPYLISEEEELVIEADFSSPSIDLNDWFSSDDASSGSDVDFGLSDRISFLLQLDLSQLTYKTFEASKVKGTCSLKNGVFNAEPIAFQCASGDVNGRLRLTERSENEFMAICRVQLDGLDVPTVFEQFEDFGQDFLRQEHLKGTADATISYSCTFDNGLAVDMNSINTVADFKIVDGELIQHPSMVDIIEAIKDRNLIKPFVRIDELEKQIEHIRFAELTNRIRIDNRNIEIPEMLISTNAMDLNISGDHSFDNLVDYRLNFRLREILVNKEDPEFLVEDDGLGHRVYLRMHGPVGDPDIDMDKESARQSRKEAIAEAGSDIKQFFKDPLGKKSDDDKKTKEERVITTVQFDDDEPMDIKFKKDSTKTVTATNNTIWIAEDEEEEEEDDDF